MFKYARTPFFHDLVQMRLTRRMKQRYKNQNNIQETKFRSEIISSYHS